MADLIPIMISELDLATSLTSGDFVAGYRLNDDSTKKNYRYAKNILLTLRMPITIDGTDYVLSNGDQTLTGDYFNNTITAIAIGGGIMYIAGPDFTQTGTSITFNSTTLYTGQQIVAFQ